MTVRRIRLTFTAGSPEIVTSLPTSDTEAEDPSPESNGTPPETPSPE